MPEMPSNPRELSVPEQILLGATRLWVVKSGGARTAYAETAKYFAMFGIERAASSHSTIMLNTVTTATRPVSINCLCSPSLTRDEARIVHAVGHVQAERDRAARAELASWLPQAALRLTMPVLTGLAATMSRKGYIVDVRPWRMERAAPDGRVTAQASNLVH